MALQLIDLSLDSPQENLALDEALLLEAESAAAEGRELGRSCAGPPAAAPSTRAPAGSRSPSSCRLAIARGSATSTAPTG